MEVWLRTEKMCCAHHISMSQLSLSTTMVRCSLCNYCSVVCAAAVGAPTGLRYTAIVSYTPTVSCSCLCWRLVTCVLYNTMQPPPYEYQIQLCGSPLAWLAARTSFIFEWHTASSLCMLAIGR